MAKINYKNVIVGVIIFLLLGAVCYLMFKPQQVAVLDIEAVVSSYDKALAVEKEIGEKQQELVVFLDKAKNEFNKGKTEKEKAELDAKYTAEYNKKASELVEYSKKEIEAVRNDITAAAQKVAKKKTGSDVVYEIKAVVAGNVDITEDVKAELAKNNKETEAKK